MAGIISGAMPTAMASAFVPPPVSPGHQCRAEQQDQDRVPDLTEQDGESTHPVQPRP
jgi:hypothetical protein